MSQKAMSKLCKIVFVVGVCTSVFAIASGCQALDYLRTKELPQTITVKDDTVPHFIKEGEPAPFEGVILSKPLFIEYAPCFEKGPPVPIPQTKDDGDAPKPTFRKTRSGSSRFNPG